MRVIAGTARSIQLVGPSSDSTRPLSDRARESMFNILGGRVADAAVLDLFAGTGAVGVEALSRGAGRVVFIERERAAAEDITENIRRVDGADRAELRRTDAFSFLRSRSAAPFDIAFSGPPQWDDLWRSALASIDQATGLLTPDGVVITQLDPREDGDDPELQHLERTDERTYGRIRLLFHTPVRSTG